jgi:hypothetical protein
MKGKIRSLLNKNLGVFAMPLYEDLTDALVADVSGVPDVRIRWTWFEEDIVQQYSVKLVGWTAGKDTIDPSNLVPLRWSSARSLRQCGLASVASKSWGRQRQASGGIMTITAGIAKHCAPHCDASQPCKHMCDKDDTDEDEENKPPCPNNTDNNTGATVSGPLPKK